MRHRVRKGAVLLGLVTVSVMTAAPESGGGSGPDGKGSGPCLNQRTRAHLLCPDLKVARPSEMYVDRKTIRGKTLLRATNDIRSRGLGPIELRGHRDRERSMAVLQAIRKRAGGYLMKPTQARLRFFNVGYRWGGSYWKVRDPLEFELWNVNRQGQRTRMVRKGPKQFYCFRDLERTRPGPGSPGDFVYPACDQNPKSTNVTLGTSVGWSDIYPSSYDHQWINVTGLRPGCYAYVLEVDPKGLFYELNEHNNTSQRIVRLPYRSTPNQNCPTP